MDLQIIQERLNWLIHFIGNRSHTAVNNAHGGNMYKGLTFDQFLYSKGLDHLVHTNAPRVPRFTDKMGKYFTMPDAGSIYLSEDVARMYNYSFDLLLEYSSTIPTGKYIGKMWKRYQDGQWYLCWFDQNIDPNLYTIHMVKIEVLPKPNYLYMFDDKRTLIIEGQVTDFNFYRSLQNQQKQLLIARNKNYGN